MGIPEKEKEGVGEGKGTRIREDKGHRTREEERVKQEREEGWRRCGGWMIGKKSRGPRRFAAFQIADLTPPSSVF